MSDYRIGPNDIALRFQYEAMIEENAVDLSQYEIDDIHLPYNILDGSQCNDDYVTNLYKKCIQERKPWQEYIKPIKEKENVIY